MKESQQKEIRTNQKGMIYSSDVRYGLAPRLKVQINFLNRSEKKKKGGNGGKMKKKKNGFREVGIQ